MNTDSRPARIDGEMDRKPPSVTHRLLAEYGLDNKAGPAAGVRYSDPPGRGSTFRGLRAANQAQRASGPGGLVRVDSYVRSLFLGGRFIGIRVAPVKRFPLLPDRGGVGELIRNRDPAQVFCWHGELGIE